MLRQSDLKILSSLRQKPRVISEIADQTELAQDTVQRRTKQLRDWELIEIVDGGGRPKQAYRRRRTGIATALDRATDSIPHVELKTFLTPSMLSVIYWLNTPLSPSEIAKRIDVSRGHVQQLLSTLVQRQFVTKPGRGEYEIKPEYERLMTLAEEMAYYMQWCEIREVLPDSTLIWAAPREALVVPSEPTEGIADELVPEQEWTVTGLAAYQDFGLNFALADAPLLYRNTAAGDGKVELTAPDIVCHTLCRRLDHRLLRFSALVLLDATSERGVKLKQFGDTATVYGVEREIKALAEYLKSRGDLVNVSTELSDLFPSWDRLVETGEQYDIDVEAAVKSLDTTQ